MLFLISCFFITSSYLNLLTQHDPLYNFEIAIYKRKGSPLPCVTGFLKDSATAKPLTVGALVINGVIIRINNQGQAYAEVTHYRKFETIAKAYSYFFCHKTLNLSKGDSLVCTYYMRRNRNPEQ